jgi:hypothetical protein
MRSNGFYGAKKLCRAQHAVPLRILGERVAHLEEKHRQDGGATALKYGRPAEAGLL